MSALEFKNVSKIYNAENTGLHDLSFLIEQGEFVAFSGPSGSGKTTILNIAAGLDGLDEGEVSFFGQRVDGFSQNDWLSLRRNEVGFIFQSYNLFPVLNVIENVEYPMALKGITKDERLVRAREMLLEVGLSELEHRFPNQLSGGQQQRVAIARAMVNKPKIIFADEPTANLDASTSQKLLVLFRRLNRQNGVSFIFSSHDARVLKLADRVIELSDGRIVKDEIKSTLSTKSVSSWRLESRKD